jgi:pilus assembly protein CpaB
MNRNTRTAVVVGIAVLLAAIASLGMYRIVSRMPGKAADVKTVDVVVAQHPLSLGTRILKDHVKIVRWPADAPVEGAYANIADVIDRGVISPVAVNEPLTDAKLAALEAGAGLPPSIPQGMRAISVKVNEVVGVAGFVVPGTRVDVMVTLRGRQNNDDSMTRIVCSNVQVLTAGTRYDQEKAKDGNAIPSTVVTLLVKPDDGERIALAAEEGQLMLSLRNPLDVEQTVTTGVKTAGLFGEPTPAPKPRSAPARRSVKADALPAVAPPPAVVPYRVEALRGGKRSEEVVKPGGGGDQ